jgi:hypothetical protein
MAGGKGTCRRGACRRFGVTRTVSVPGEVVSASCQCQLGDLRLPNRARSRARFSHPAAPTRDIYEHRLEAYATLRRRVATPGARR